MHGCRGITEIVLPGSEQGMLCTKPLYSYGIELHTDVNNQNALSDFLSPLGVNLYSLFLPDFLHEIELGDWRNLFIHLLRVLDSYGGPSLLAELDCRYA
jgi:hypothetical protein